MKYAVHWSRRALGVVTREWLAEDSERRSAISHTIAAIDEMLELLRWSAENRVKKGIGFSSPPHS